MQNVQQCLVTRSSLVATGALLPLFFSGFSVAVAATGITSYSNFLTGVTSSQFEQFENRIDSRVLDKYAFTAMQKHILRHYHGVQIANSFLDQSGNPIDCITLKSQPSLQSRKMRSHKLATLPKALARTDQSSAKRVSTSKGIKPQLSYKMKDLSGNIMYCRKGTIPMRRLTLETLTRFRTLDDFFSKGPIDKRPGKSDSQKNSASESAPRPEDEYTDYWAYARQTVDNSSDSRSRPPTRGLSTTPAWFSLAQHWYVGGTGGNKQTVEGGWQLAERKYDNTNPNLFIYSTNANYDEGSGCYNLDCAAFVQINNNWVLGGELGPISTTDGTQYNFRMQWQLHHGNWWLFLKGKGSTQSGVANYHAIGYYPQEWFTGRQLTQHATAIGYAGETSSLAGQMAGGRHAAEGWFECVATGCRIDLAQTDTWPHLTQVDNRSDCYTADLHNQTDTTWATYLYFGGSECLTP